MPIEMEHGEVCQVSLLDVSDITVKFGGITALDRLSFDIDEGEICALIGPNGAGKTTLFNVVSRIYDPTEGSVTFDNIDLLGLAPHHLPEGRVSHVPELGPLAGDDGARERDGRRSHANEGQLRYLDASSRDRQGGTGVQAASLGRPR